MVYFKTAFIDQQGERSIMEPEYETIRDAMDAIIDIDLSIDGHVKRPTRIPTEIIKYFDDGSYFTCYEIVHYTHPRE